MVQTLTDFLIFLFTLPYAQAIPSDISSSFSLQLTNQSHPFYLVRIANSVQWVRLPPLCTLVSQGVLN